MARPYTFPDPNYRSPYEPAIIVNSDQILGLYKQSTDEDMKNVTSKVQAWFQKTAKEYCWDNIEFVGNECILKVNIEMRKIPQE